MSQFFKYMTSFNPLGITVIERQCEINLHIMYDQLDSVIAYSLDNTSRL